MRLHVLYTLDMCLLLRVWLLWEDLFSGSIPSAVAPQVWKILDLDDDGTLDADEFLSGCLRLRGPAKTLDVLAPRHHAMP